MQNRAKTKKRTPRTPQSILISMRDPVEQLSVGINLADQLLQQKAINIKDLITADEASEERRHPDLIILTTTVKEKESHGIEEIQSMRRQLMYKPFSAKVKVAFIHEAQKMTVEAQNALLKTLEEPPINTHIILTVDNPKNLLPTVISRCQIYSLQQEEEIVQEFDAEEILKSDLIAKFKAVEKMISIKDRKKQREQIENLLKLLTMFFRGQLLKEVEKKGRGDKIKLWVDAIQKCNEARMQIANNVNKRLVLENLMVQLKT